MHKVPDPVKNIKLTRSYNDSLFFSWTIPEGLLDSFLVTCSILNLGIVLSAKVELNTTNSSFCFNLLPSTSYEISVTSIRSFNDRMYSNAAKAYSNTCITFNISI